MSPYDSRIYNYLGGIYSETRHKFNAHDIEWHIETNRIVIKCYPPVYAQIKPYIDSQCTQYWLKQSKRTYKGRITLDIRVENADKLLRYVDGKLKIGDMSATGGVIT
jgi:hypothetical protein